MLLDFLDYDRYYPIYTLLSSYLGISEIVALTRTCKKLSNLYQQLLPSFWDIDRGLRHFLDDPVGFRAQMKQHGALVTGEFASQFCKRETGEVSEMEVLIRSGPNRDAFIRYLLQAEGYNVDSCWELPYTYVSVREYEDVRCGVRYSFSKRDYLFTNTFYKQGHRLRRKFTDSGVTSCITIRVRAGIPLCSNVYGIHPRVNIICWNKAYAIFPQFNFVNRMDWSLTRFKLKIIDEFGFDYSIEDYHRCLHFDEIELHFEDDEWQQAHYSDFDDIFGPCLSPHKTPWKDLSFMIGKRHIGDRYTWTIPFDTGKLCQSDESLDAQLQHTQFSVFQVYDRHFTRGYEHVSKYNERLIGCWVMKFFEPRT